MRDARIRDLAATLPEAKDGEEAWLAWLARARPIFSTRFPEHADSLREVAGLREPAGRILRVRGKSPAQVDATKARHRADRANALADQIERIRPQVLALLEGIDGSLGHDTTDDVGARPDDDAAYGATSPEGLLLDYFVEQHLKNNLFVTKRALRHAPPVPNALDVAERLGPLLDPAGPDWNPSFTLNIDGALLSPRFGGPLREALAGVLLAIRALVSEKPDREKLEIDGLLRAIPGPTPDRELLCTAMDLACMGIPRPDSTPEYYPVPVDIDDIVEYGSVLDLISRAARKRGALRQSNPEAPMPADNTVFVVHGWDEDARDQLVAFLQRIQIDVITWERADQLSGKGSPSNFDIVNAGLSASAAVVVLFTPDEVAQPRPEYGASQPRHQPRPNVLLEAGWAYGSKGQKGTIIVESGMRNVASDLDGFNVVRMNGARSLNQLMRRLKNAGLSPDPTLDDRSMDPSQYPKLFQAAPPISASVRTPDPAAATAPTPADAAQLRRIIAELDDSGFVRFLEEQDFGAGYREGKDEPGYRFIEDEKRVDHEFLDPELEQLRVGLVNAMRRFISELSGSISAEGKHVRITTEEQYVRHGMERKEAKKLFTETQGRLNDLSDEAVGAYKLLVREGRQRLSTLLTQ